MTSSEFTNYKNIVLDNWIFGLTKWKSDPFDNKVKVLDSFLDKKLFKDDTDYLHHPSHDFDLIESFINLTNELEIACTLSIVSEEVFYENTTNYLALLNSLPLAFLRKFFKLSLFDDFVSRIYESHSWRSESNRELSYEAYLSFYGLRRRFTDENFQKFVFSNFQLISESDWESYKQYYQLASKDFTEPNLNFKIENMVYLEGHKSFIMLCNNLNDIFEKYARLNKFVVSLSKYFNHWFLFLIDKVLEFDKINQKVLLKLKKVIKMYFDEEPPISLTLPSQFYLDILLPRQIKDDYFKKSYTKHSICLTNLYRKRIKIAGVTNHVIRTKDELYFLLSIINNKDKTIQKLGSKVLSELDNSEKALTLIDDLLNQYYYDKNGFQLKEKSTKVEKKNHKNTVKPRKKRRFHGISMPYFIQLDKVRKIALIGFSASAANLINTIPYSKFNWDVTKIFDNDEKKIGTSYDGIRILNLDQIIRELRLSKIDTVFLNLPRSINRKISKILSEERIQVKTIQINKKMIQRKTSYSFELKQIQNVEEIISNIEDCLKDDKD